MKSRIIGIVLAASLAVLVGPTLRAQEKGKPAPEAMTGPKVGEKAPSFVLKDQDGKERSLEEFTGKGKVALVFYRSADW